MSQQGGNSGRSSGAIRYEPLPTRATNPAIYDAAVSLLVDSFHKDEPTTTATGCPEESHRKFFQIMTPQMADNGLSVVAIASSGDHGDDEVAGVFIAEDFSSPPPESLNAFAEQNWDTWGPVFQILDEAEEAFKARWGVPKGELPEQASNGQQKKFCHLWCVAVDAEKFGRRGIGRTLAENVLGKAEARGFAVSFAEATGAFSAKLLAKVGMRATGEWKYAEWVPAPAPSEVGAEGESDGESVSKAASAVKPPLIGVAAPHTATLLMEREHRGAGAGE